MMIDPFIQTKFIIMIMIPILNTIVAGTLVVTSFIVGKNAFRSFRSLLTNENTTAIVENINENTNETTIVEDFLEHNETTGFDEMDVFNDILSMVDNLPSSKLDDFSKNFGYFRYEYLEQHQIDVFQIVNNQEDIVLKTLQSRYLFPDEFAQILLTSGEKQRTEELVQILKYNEDWLQLFDFFNLNFSNEKQLYLDTSFQPQESNIFILDYLLDFDEEKFNNFLKQTSQISLKYENHVPNFIQDFEQKNLFPLEQKNLNIKLIFLKKVCSKQYEQLYNSNCWIYDSFLGFVKFRTLCETVGLEKQQNWNTFLRWFDGQLLEEYVASSSREHEELQIVEPEISSQQEAVAESSTQQAVEGESTQRAVYQTISPSEPSSSSKNFVGLGIAAGIVGLLGIGLVVYRFFTNTNNYENLSIDEAMKKLREIKKTQRKKKLKEKKRNIKPFDIYPMDKD